MSVLAADIGGTNARFALGTPDTGAMLRVLEARTYASRHLDGPADGIHRFLRETGGTVEVAVVALAGTVRGGVGTMTNRSWTVDTEAIAEAAGTDEAVLLNDFVALGHALPHLESTDRVELQRGRADPDGVVGLLGAGTGLGQALLVPARPGRGHAVFATEAGHGDFAPRNEVEWELRAYLRRRSDHVSWEHVLSGSGLCAVYDYLVESGRVTEDPTTRRAMERGHACHVVSGRGVSGTDRACVAALELYTRLYGSKAGITALSLGATGGVWIGGGLARHLLPVIRRGGFMEAFRGKGRMRSWLSDVPVHVVVRDDAGLLGAMTVGIRRVAGSGSPTPAEASR
jgi:glucokinase